MCPHTNNWNDKAVDLCEQQHKLLSSLIRINKTISLPRFIPYNFSSQLHFFMDSSQQFFSSVIYLRTNDNDNIWTSSLFAKSRFEPPSKTITISRMELSFSKYLEFQELREGLFSCFCISLISWTFFYIFPRTKFMVTKIAACKSRSSV